MILANKIPVAAKKIGIESLENYYNMHDMNLRNCNIRKAARRDHLTGKFLKDCANILAISVRQICNISIKLSHFLKDCRVGKLKLKKSTLYRS